MNNLFRSDRIGKFDTYRDAFTTKRTCHFDEAGIMACDKELGFRFYKHPQDMADIDSSSFRFKCFAVKNYISTISNCMERRYFVHSICC